MNTLIVACAGRSSRFPNTRPKWMLYYPDGKMMVEKAIEGLKGKEFDQIIITIVKDHVIKYQADQILEDIFHFHSSKIFKLCVLDDYTSCQAETVYQTIVLMGINGSFVVKDSDNYLCFIEDLKEDYVVGLNVNSFGQDIERLGEKSFLIVNDQGIVTDIIEKRIVSDIICVGMYGFRSAELFIDAYHHLCDVAIDNNEIYLSHVISYLIGTKQSVYKYVEAKEYEDWGTLKDWYKVLNRKSLIMISIDGLLFEKTENYGPGAKERISRPIQQNIAKLKELSDAGNQIVLLTSMDEKWKQSILELMGEYEITIHQLIMNCALSHYILVNTFSPEIPYPGCESINICLGGQLSDYL